MSLSTSHPVGDPRISVVIPVHNEIDSLEELVTRVAASLEGERWELILVDDGSSDGSRVLLRRLAAADPRVVTLGTRRRRGQTLALQAGLSRVRGEIVVTLDGDLQNLPEDIPRMVTRLELGADVVTGWRRRRRDPWLTRKLPSMVANAWIRSLTGVRIHDHGCGLKVFRRWVVDALDLYGDHHRLITGVCALHGARITEVEVGHEPRRTGRSKYGTSRILRVLADVLAMHVLLHYRRRPSAWFVLLAAPMFLGAVAASAGMVGGLRDGSAVVLAGVALVLGFSALTLLAYGLFAELLLRWQPSRGGPFLPGEEA